MWNGETLALNHSHVDCTKLSRDFSLMDSVEEVGKLSRMSSSFAYSACITCHYRGVVVALISSIARHIDITSNDTFSDIAGKGSPRTHMPIDATDNMFTWDDIVHMKLATVRLGTVVLQLVQAVKY